MCLAMRQRRGGNRLLEICWMEGYQKRIYQQWAWRLNTSSNSTLTWLERRPEKGLRQSKNNTERLQQKQEQKAILGLEFEQHHPFERMIKEEVKRDVPGLTDAALISFLQQAVDKGAFILKNAQLTEKCFLKEVAKSGVKQKKNVQTLQHKRGAPVSSTSAKLTGDNDSSKMSRD